MQRKTTRKKREPRRPGRPRADETNQRERLLDAAVACFAADGVAADEPAQHRAEGRRHARARELLLRQQGAAARRVHRRARDARSSQVLRESLLDAGDDPRAAARRVRARHPRRRRALPVVAVALGARGAERERRAARRAAQRSSPRRSRSCSRARSSTRRSAARSARISTRGCSSSRWSGSRCSRSRPSRSGGACSPPATSIAACCCATRWRCSITVSEASMRVDARRLGHCFAAGPRLLGGLRRARPRAARRHARVGPRRRDGRARGARAAAGPSPKAIASRRAPSLLELDARRQDARIAEAHEPARREPRRGSRSSRTARASRRSTRRARTSRARAPREDDAETEYTRVAELRKRELVAQSAVDQALAARNQRRAETQAAEAQLRELTQGTRPEQIEQAAAAVDAAQAPRSTRSS